MNCVKSFEFDYAHRVLGHSGKCINLHGHRGKVEIHCQGNLDTLGMVIDFSVIKEHVGKWIDLHWDHATIINKDDVLRHVLETVFENQLIYKPIFTCDFNPTAENLATYLLEIASNLLHPFQITVTEIVFWETPTSRAHAYATPAS